MQLPRASNDYGVDFAASYSAYLSGQGALWMPQLVGAMLTHELSYGAGNEDSFGEAFGVYGI